MKQISVKIEDDVLAWLENEIEEGRFASVSHGVRYALKKLREEKE